MGYRFILYRKESPLMRPSNSLIMNNLQAGSSNSSIVVWATDIIRCSVQVSVSSGSLSGTFQLQSSNDQATGLPPNQFIPTNWTSLGSASVIASSSTLGVGVFMIPSLEVSYEYLRVVFGSTSGALGLYSARLVAKAL